MGKNVSCFYYIRAFHLFLIVYDLNSVTVTKKQMNLQNLVFNVCVAVVFLKGMFSFFVFVYFLFECVCYNFNHSWLTSSMDCLYNVFA